MTLKVTIAARELTALRAGTVPESLLLKLEKAEMLAGAPRVRGLSPQVAAEAFKEVLGNRLVLPPSGAGGAWGAMGARIKALGLSRGDCVNIAKAAAADWRPGPIRAESLVRQADVLLTSLQKGLPFQWGSSEPIGGWQGAAPMEDE